MEGNAKIIKLIARIEALHLTGTQHMINLLRNGQDDFNSCRSLKSVSKNVSTYSKKQQSKKKWAEYLFKDGSMIGLNKDILCQYVEYVQHPYMQAVGLGVLLTRQRRTQSHGSTHGYLPDNVQVAPQEAEISSYLVGQIDNEVKADDFEGFEL